MFYVIFYARNQVSFNTDPTRFRFECVLFVRLTLDLGVMAVLPLYFAFSAGLVRLFVVVLRLSYFSYLDYIFVFKENVLVFLIYLSRHHSIGPSCSVCLTFFSSGALFWVKT